MAILVSISRPMGQTEDLPWFDSISTENPLDLNFGDELSKATTEILFNSQKTPPSFSDSLKSDRENRLLYLSISDSSSAPYIFLGRGEGLQRAWRVAINQAMPLLEEGFKVRWARLDVVDSARERKVGGDSPLLLPGIDGLAFDRQSNLVLLPGQLIANRLLSENGKLLESRILKYAKKNRERGSSYLPFKMSTGYVFTTKAWLINRSRTQRLNAGADPRPNLPTSFQLSKNMNHMSQQLLSNQKKIGSFYHDELVNSKNSKQKSKNGRITKNKINPSSIMSAQGLAIWSLLQPEKSSEKTSLIGATRLGVDFIIRNSVPCPGYGAGFMCVDENIETMITSNAFAALAISAYIEKTGNRSLIPQLRKIMRGLMKTILIQFSKIPGGGLVSNRKLLQKTVNEFSIAIYTLMRMHHMDPDPRWLNTAIDIAGRILKYENSREIVSNLEHSMWLSLGLERLYRETDDPQYKRYLKEVAELAMESQIINHQRQEWIGGFEPRLVSSYTAAQIVSLVAASTVVADAPSLERIDRSVKLAVRNLLGFRLKPDAALYFDEPKSVVNRLKKSHFNNATSSRDLALGLIALYLYSEYLGGAKTLSL